jgi:RNase P/RNase MRP subunit p30
VTLLINSSSNYQTSAPQQNKRPCAATVAEHVIFVDSKKENVIRAPIVNEEV